MELNDNGDISKYITWYKANNTDSYNITSDTFLNNDEWMKALYWPKPWNANGTLQPLVLRPLLIDIAPVKIYVTDDEFFNVELPKFNIKDNEKTNDHHSNSYVAAIFAAYITTYVCGISRKQIAYNDNTPKIITSIVRYHIYYHMRRFLRQPTKMDRFLTKEIKAYILKNLPERYEWVQ